MTEAVYLVRSLEEIREAERLNLPPVPVWLMAFVRARTAVANGIARQIANMVFTAPPAAPRRVVVFTFGTLGDHVVLLPSLAALREAFPGAHITLLSSTGGIGPAILDDLLGDGRLVDDIVCVPDPPTRRRGLLVTYAEGLDRVQGCDLFVNLSPFGNRGLANAVFRELLIAKRIGARSAVGFRVRGWGGRHLNRVLHRFQQNEPRRGGEVINVLGLAPTRPELAIPEYRGARATLQERLGRNAENRDIVVVHPGAKQRLKCWPVDRFRAVAAAQQSRTGALIAVTGLADEHQLGREIVEGLPGVALNLCGLLTVRELVELLRLSSLCVTTDTGTMHLAAMLGRPTVALFTTRLSPTHWFPLGPKVVALMAFNGGVYDFAGEGNAHGSLLRIGTDDVLRAIALVQQVAQKC